MKPFRPRTALVTGATGFIGSHVVRRLLRDEWYVHAPLRPHSNTWRLQDVLACVERHVWVGLEDREALRDLVDAVRPEWVFHLASANMAGGLAPSLDDLFAVNVRGTANLLEACSAVDYQAFVAAGDSFEYAPSRSRLSETSPTQPMSPYGIAKLASTLYARSVALVDKRPIVVLRLFSVFGPFDDPRRFIPRVIAHSLAAEPLPLSHPGTIRDWVYVADVVELFVEAALKARAVAGGVFNAGSGVATDLAGIVDAIQRLTGARTEPRWGTFASPAHDDYPWVADPEHAFATFEWRPRTTLDEGLLAAIEHARTVVR